jgi:Uma2 family endonuclease
MTARTDSSDAPPLATEIAKLFPPQGRWSEADYLELTSHCRGMVEFVEGTVEVLEVPTEAHQLIVQYLFLTLHSFVAPRELGTTVLAPFRIRTTENRFREPDLALLLAERRELRGNDYWSGADLVVEVVSDDPKGRRRDLETKREEYARAGVREYWIVDPSKRLFTVLTLADLTSTRYEVFGEFAVGQLATSSLLAGFSVDVGSVFLAAEH